MYKKEKTIIIQGASINELWEAHTDISNWSKWQNKIEWTKVSGEINKGTKFTIKPKGNPKVNLEILTFNKPYVFTDISYLPLCKMFTTTKMREVENGVEIKLIIEMKGLLTFLWKKIIAKEILDSHFEQNQSMVNYINSLKNEK